MGLLRGMARTAVVAGTATAVSNRVSRRQAERWQQQDYEQQAQYEQQARAAYAAQPPPAPAPAAPAAPAEDSLADQLSRLADLKAQGVLSDEEFAAAKARLLGG
ncbi:SHOCT domain-containing protein [Jiangella sp. DSM 45060]|uniref:SHOCT domain-containing protein n=1 Tax=Jiangella sp. DSM 45060 TaxID=1798224 RepID=UPI0008795F12|nr:SHOCT domain-containing protein [Jiangella sp. DSM 45060]SDT07487.1 Short C-terminal domain-containing protein [Jiangella sp. DSM 45060]